MGRYLAVEVQLDQPVFPESALEALLSFPYFHPGVLAGIDGHETGDDWFLSGYALEEVVTRFASRATRAPAAIHQAAADDGANRNYLEQMTESLRSGSLRSGKPPATLSPFEQKSTIAPLTYLQDRKIGATEIREAALWSAQHPGAVFQLYGAFSLEVKPETRDSAPWDRAFRELDNEDSHAGQPFVAIRFGRDPLTKILMDLSLMSWSTVWLTDGEALNGLVGATEAAENRRRLGMLVETILQAEEHRLVSASLRVDGRQFLAHERELREAIRELQIP
jgi:hypothetical protein